MKSRLLGLIASLVFLPVAWGALDANAQNEVAPRERLVNCLSDRSRPLAVLFLVDTSSSLGDEDDEEQRVVGLQRSVEALKEVVSLGRPVYVDVVRFGTGAQRAFEGFGLWEAWRELTATDDRLVDLMAKFGEPAFYNNKDTDYGAALDFAARQSLDIAPSKACRLVIMFTDGRYDYEFDGSNPAANEVTWFPNGGIPPSDQGIAGLIAAAQAEVCANNGVADLVQQGSDYVVAVGLGDPTRFDFLRRMVSRSGEPCGNGKPLGDVLQANDTAQLVELLIQATDPAQLVTFASSFRVSQLVTSMRMRIDWSGGPAELRTPDPEVVIPLTGEGSGSVDGAEVYWKVTAESDSQARVTFNFPLGARERLWYGEWSVSAASVPQLMLLNIEGGARLQFVNDVNEAYADFTSSVNVRLVAQDGDNLRAIDEAAASTKVEVDGQSLQLNDQGAATVEVTGRAAGEEIVLVGRVAPRVVVFDDVPARALPDWEGEIGRIQVKPKPSYPIFGQPEPIAESIDQDRRTIRTGIPVTALDGDSGGCVTLDYVDVPSERSGFSVELRNEDDEVVSPQKECGVRVSPGETTQLQVVITASAEEARRRGDVEIGVGFTASAEAPLPGEESSNQSAFNFPVSVEPKTGVDPPSPWDMLPFLLAAVMVPLGLLYGYNALIGARLVVKSTSYVVVSARLVGKDLQDPDRPGYPVDLARLELNPIYGGQGKVTSFSAGGFEFRRKLSGWPWGEPKCVVEKVGAPQTVGPLGVVGSLGRAPLTLSVSWALAGDFTNPSGNHNEAATMSANGADSPAVGAAGPLCTVLVLLHAEGLGRGLEGFTSEITESLTSAGDRAAQIHAEALVQPPSPRVERPGSDRRPDADGPAGPKYSPEPDKPADPPPSLIW